MNEELTADKQSEDIARAEAVLGESLQPTDVPQSTQQLVDVARRALLRRIAEMAEANAEGIEHVAEALRAVEGF